MRRLVNKLKALIRNEAAEAVEIRFKVNSPFLKDAEPSLANVRLADNAAHADVIEYLRTCLREARKLPRCELTPAKRMAAGEAFLAAFVPIVFRQVKSFSGEGGVPDPEPRQVILDTIVEVVRLLAESYKMSFVDAWTGSGKFLEASAFRVLELARLQQRVCGLRYQALRDSEWLAVNNIFHAVRDAGKADTRHIVLEHFALPEDPPKTQSIEGVFLSIQLVARLDLLRWPVEWQAHAFVFGSVVRRLVKLVDDPAGGLLPGNSVSYAYDARPARSKWLPDDDASGSLLVINWSALLTRMFKDYSALADDSTPDYLKKIPDRLATVPQSERLALAQLQLECVSSEEPAAAPQDVPGTAADMRIFIGFAAVYQLVLTLHGNPDAVGTRLADVLAKRSALMGDDGAATTGSVWFVLYEDAALIRLKTQETRFTTRLKIGAPAAYGIGREGIAKPSFGVVARIQRSSATTVVVDILKHGNYVAAVVLSKDPEAFAKPEGQAEVVGGIIARDGSGKDTLLLPPTATLRRKDRLVMKMATGTRSIALRKLKLVTRSFFLFGYKSAEDADARPLTLPSARIASEPLPQPPGHARPVARKLA
jgi:hypothetical protein